MLDETFGKGNVNLDELVEQNINSALALREKYTTKKIAHDKKIDNIKAGLVKLTNPIKTMANNAKAKAEINKQIKLEKYNAKVQAKADKHKQSLIDEIEAQ